MGAFNTKFAAFLSRKTANVVGGYNASFFCGCSLIGSGTRRCCGSALRLLLCRNRILSRINSVDVLSALGVLWAQILSVPPYTETDNNSRQCCGKQQGFTS